MTTRTVQNALAYIAITGKTRHLHIGTMVAIISFERLDIPTMRHVLTDEGQKLAERSPLWRAHQKLLAMGFEVDRSRKASPRFISYIHPEQHTTKTGKAFWRTAFTGKHGTAYAEQPSDETASGWKTQEV
jgi:hypothetical protein